LGTLGSGTLESRGFGVSSDGNIVVGSSDSSLGDQAFIWDSLVGMQSVQELLTNDFGLDLTGWVLQSATGISGDGRTVVGFGTNPFGHTEGWIAVIPEPASGWSMVLVGGVLVMMVRWGRVSGEVN